MHPSLSIRCRPCRGFISALLCFGLFQGPVQAQNEFDLTQLAPNQTLLNLSVTEETEVDQDLLTAVLQYSARGGDRTALQEEVNAVMADARALLANSEGLEFSIQQYHVYAMTPPRGSRRDLENPVWQARQSVRLSGKDSTALLDMAGRLQQAGLHMVNLDYSLSPDTYRNVANGLLATALKTLQARADETATLLNKGGATLLEISFNDTRNTMFRQEARAMAADSAAFNNPVAEPGKTTVSLSISARALLSP